MKIENPKFILKSVTNESLPDLREELAVLQDHQSEHCMNIKNVVSSSVDDKFDNNDPFSLTQVRKTLGCEDAVIAPRILSPASRGAETQAIYGDTASPDTAKCEGSIETCNDDHLPSYNFALHRTRQIKRVNRKSIYDVPTQWKSVDKFRVSMDLTQKRFTQLQDEMRMPQMNQTLNRPVSHFRDLPRDGLYEHRQFNMLPPETPRTCLLNTLLLENGTSEFWTPQIRQTPKIMPFKTPRCSNIQICSTPALPQLHGLALDVLSTPALFPDRKETGVPDLLHLIDSGTMDLVDANLGSFDAFQVTDDNVADFVLDMCDGYSVPKSRQTPRSIKHRFDVKIDMKKAKGAHCKRVTADIEEALLRTRREKDARRRKTSRKMKFSKTNICNSQYDVQRKIKLGGRRTRSLIKACKETGLASTNEELDALFTVTDDQL